EQPIELTRSPPFDLVEHEVLEEVREPRLPFALVARADAKPRVIGDDGRRVVLADEHLEAVGEPIAPDGERRAERNRLDELNAPVGGSRRVQLRQPRRGALGPCGPGGAPAQTGGARARGGMPAGRAHVQPDSMIHATAWNSAGAQPSSLSTARNASCGSSTLPTAFMRRFPSFCFSRSLRFRVMSPP